MKTNTKLPTNDYLTKNDLNDSLKIFKDDLNQTMKKQTQEFTEVVNDLMLKVGLKFDEQDSKFSLITKELTDIKQEVGGIKQEITGIKQEIGGIKQEVSGIKQEIDGIKQEVSGIKQEIDGIKQEVSGIKQEIGGIKQEVSGIKQEIGGIKQKVSGIKQEICSMKKEATSNKNEILNSNLQIIDELKTSREEQITLSYRQRENTNQLRKHSTRISSLEDNYQVTT